MDYTQRCPKCGEQMNIFIAPNIHKGKFLKCGNCGLETSYPRIEWKKDWPYFLIVMGGLILLFKLFTGTTFVHTLMAAGIITLIILFFILPGKLMK
jgi:ribosomal protein S27AE